MRAPHAKRKSAPPDTHPRRGAARRPRVNHLRGPKHTFVQTRPSTGGTLVNERAIGLGRRPTIVERHSGHRVGRRLYCKY